MRTVSTLAVFAALLALPASAQQETKRFDLRSFKPPTLSGPIVGHFSYSTPFDNRQRSLQIRKMDDARWPYQATLGESQRAVIKLARAEGGVGYSGRVDPDFDPCLKDGARAEKVVLLDDTLVVELLVSHSAMTPLPRCRDLLRFTLLGSGQIRLKPESELKIASNGADLSFAADASRVPAGSVVAVGRTLTDTTGDRWTQVQVLGDPHSTEDSKSDKQPFGYVRAEQVGARVRYELTRINP